MCILVKLLWVVRLVVFNYLDLLQLVVRSVSLHIIAQVNCGVYIFKPLYHFHNIKRESLSLADYLSSFSSHHQSPSFATDKGL